jgi:signal transduction histidine kinase/CheY-like chemotaxis protein/methyl-accepting chemotaxis protein
MDKINNRVVIIAGVFSTLLGVCVLLGWYTHNIALIQISSAFVPMQYNTALGFLLSGLGLMFLHLGFSRLLTFVGTLVLLIGSLTLIEYVFGFDLGVDQLLMEHYITTETSHPGRMAPNTALCFVLTSLTLLFGVSAQKQDTVSRIGILSALIFGLGLVAFAGYFLEAEAIYGWGKLTRMAIHTAVGFIVIGIGLFTVALSLEGKKSNSLPQWVLIDIGIVLVTIVLSLWQALTAGAYIMAVTITVMTVTFGIGAYTFRLAIKDREEGPSESQDIITRLLSTLLFFQHSIQWKIIISTIIPIAIIYLLFLGIAFSSLEDSSSKHEEEQIGETVNQIATLINNEFIQVTNIANLTARFIETTPNLTSDEIYKLVKTNVENNKLVYGSAIAYEPYQFADDTRLFSPYAYQNNEAIELLDIGDPDPQIGYDYTNNKWQWWDEAKARGEGIWTEPYNDEGAGNIAMTTYSAPFYKNGNYQGVVTIDVELESLLKTLNINIESDRIITSSGHFILHSDPDMILNASIFDLAEKYNQKDLLEIGRNIVNGNYGLYKTQGWGAWGSDEHVWIFSAPINTTGWIYLCILPESEVLGFIQKQWQTIGFMLSVTLLLVMIVIWYASGLITRPVRDLHQAVDKVSGGDFDIWVEESSKDELGKLARIFNKMASVISNREEDLEQEVEKRTVLLKQSQIELERQKEAVVDTIESMDQGVIMLDADLNIQVFNKRYPEILNLPLEVIEKYHTYEEILQYWSEHVVHYTPEKYDALVKSATHKEKLIYNYELPDGKIIEVRHIPKDIGGYVRIFTDITEQEKIKREITEQKSIVEKTLNNVEQGIVMFDKDLKVLAYNTKYSSIMEVPVDVLVTFKTYDEFIRYTREKVLNTPEVAPEIIEAASSNEFNRTFINFPNDKIIEVQHFPIKEGGAVRTFNDVTTRESITRELGTQKAIIEKTLNNIDQGIVMYDEDMTILVYNRRYSEITHIPEDVVSNAISYEELIRYNAYVLINKSDGIEDIIEKGKSNIAFTYLVHFDNGDIVEVEHIPLKDGGVIRTFTDVTEKENARTELEKRIKDLADARRASLNMMQDAEALRIKAEAATEAKANFLAAMSHEIRTPMNGIIGMVDLLRQSNISTEHSQMLQTISDSGQSLLTIINDILDFSKIEAGKLDLENVDFSTMEVLESSAETLKVNALNKGIDLITYVDPRIPQFIIGDPVRIRQILINLGGNAIKFTDKGVVTIRADLQAGDYDDEVSIHFRVIDQGIGISEAGQRKLFKAFSQAETSTTRKYGGTGLGLSICQRLTEMMRGDIGVNSKEGEGSEFYLTISFKKSGKTIQLDKVSDLAGLNIMLVSQIEMEHFICQQYLEYWHAKTIKIDDIADCQERAETCIKEGQSLDIIVLCSDWSQEQQFAIREKFKQEERLKDIKFVLLMKGRRSKPRLDNPETVQFDVGPMRRVTFLTAISIAAGRASPEVFHEEQVEDLKASNLALSVDDALKNNALILVAEDNPTNRDVISRQLKVLGYTCELANDGQAGLEAWRTGRYFILLTDCHMPEMDGYELTTAIREDEKAQSSERAPIIAITANALQGEAERCLAVGMDDYMSKPIDMRELRIKLLRWMPHFNPEEDSTKDFIATESAEDDASNVANKSDAIDPSTLMEMFGDDPVMFKEILTDFIRPSQDIIEEIKTAHQEHSTEGIKQAAHKLKSSARSVGANDLADLCLALETAGKNEDWKTIEDNVPSVDVVMEAVVSYINSL